MKESQEKARGEDGCEARQPTRGYRQGEVGDYPHRKHCLAPESEPREKEGMCEDILLNLRNRFVLKAGCKKVG